MNRNNTPVGGGHRANHGRGGILKLGKLADGVSRVLGALSILLLSAGPLLGQESPVLTLRDALDRAREYNPNTRMAENDLALSRVERLQAWGAFFPTLSLNTSTAVNARKRLTAVDDFGNPVENPSGASGWSTGSSTSQSINARLTLFDWGARRRDLETQRATARAREATVSSRLRTLRADVVRAYRAAQNQQALVAVEEELLASREVELETTRRMYDLAGATRVDVLTAELNVQQQEQRIQDAEGQLQQALLRLRTVVGDESIGSFRVDNRIPDPFDPGELDIEALSERAYGSSPSLIEQEARVAVSRAQAQSARRAHWPGLTLNFAAYQSLDRPKWIGFADPFPNESRYGSASFGIEIPIFQNFDNKARIVQAEVSLQNEEETLRQARLQVEEAVRGRFIALQTAQQSYLITVRSREIAQERLSLGREQYRLGSRTFAELQLDIDAAAQAERAVINQLFALERALADLEETVGEELR